MFFYHSGAIVTIGHLLSAQFTAIGPSILREFVGIVPRSSLRASHFWAVVACVTQKAVLYFGFGFHQNTSQTVLISIELCSAMRRERINNLSTHKANPSAVSI